MEPASAGQHASLIPVDFRAARSRQPAKPTVVLRLTIVGGWLVLAIEEDAGVDILHRCALSHRARRLLALTGAEGVFPLFDTVEQAVWTPFNPIGDDAS